MGLKEYFCRTVFDYRESRRLTQLQMAERLWMDERSYIDLEHGKNSCSVVTLMLYLMFECPDANAFFRDLRELYKQAVDGPQNTKETALTR